MAMSIVNSLIRHVYAVLHYGDYLKSIRFLQDRYHWSHKRYPFTWLDDKYFLEYYFYKKKGYRIDFKHPATFNEKLNWMKLYYRDPIYGQLSDKWSVREYISQRIGSEHLKPLIGVYDAVEEINWQDLPEKFVIKTTHGSGWNIICDDIDQFSQADAIEKVNNWMALNFYQQLREWQYKHITPRIIIEPYLEGERDLGLVEYQFYCFDGIVRFIQVDVDCNKNHSRLFFSPMWQKMPFEIVRFPTFTGSLEKPQQLDEALDLAEKLTKGFPFCRVDLHIIDGHIYISEMTLMPAGGYMKFDPPEYDLHIGSMLTLKPKIKFPIIGRDDDHS